MPKKVKNCQRKIKSPFMIYADIESISVPQDSDKQNPEESFTKNIKNTLLVVVDYLKWTSKPSYKSRKIFNNDLVAIRKSKVTLTLNKPAYVGMCILDLSIVLMYEFHYNYIKNKYGNDSRLLSLCTKLKPKMLIKILVK